jgi:hypothetical protein
MEKKTKKSATPETAKYNADYDNDQAEARIRAIAKEVFSEMMNMQQDVTTSPDRDPVPPEPKTIKGKGKGRRETRKYDRVTCTIDKNLAKLFTSEARRNGISVGKLLDRILWNRYGRPVLSYEGPEGGK